MNHEKKQAILVTNFIVGIIPSILASIIIALIYYFIIMPANLIGAPLIIINIGIIMLVLSIIINLITGEPYTNLFVEHVTGKNIKQHVDRVIIDNNYSKNNKEDDTHD